MDTFFFFLSIQIIFIFKKWAGGCLAVKPWLEPTEATTSCWGSDVYTLPLSYLLNILLAYR